MPARRLSEWEKEKRADLRQRHGGKLGLSEIKDELGVKDPKTARKWLDGLPFSYVGNRKKWDVEDIAKRLYEQRVEAVSR